MGIIETLWWLCFRRSPSQPLQWASKCHCTFLELAHLNGMQPSLALLGTPVLALLNTSQNVCRQNGLTVTKNTFQAPASSSERISTAHETSNFVLILLLLILLSRLTKEENVIMWNRTRTQSSPSDKQTPLSKNFQRTSGHRQFSLHAHIWEGDTSRDKTWGHEIILHLQ